MIERNLGNAERLLRLLLGAAILGWALWQNHLSIVDWYVLVVAVALILNGIFSRCYLWYLLDVSTCREGDRDCRSASTCL